MAATRTGQPASRPDIEVLRSFDAISLFPRYRSPGDEGVTGAIATRPAPLAATRGSSRFHHLRAKLGPHGASEQFEQHHDPVLVAQFDQPADHVFERACGHPHQLAEPQRTLWIDP